MMRVRRCTPGNEDEREHSVPAVKEPVPHKTRRELTIKVRVRNLVPSKGIKRMS